MRLLLLTTDQPNQVALAHRLADRIELCGAVLSANGARGRTHRPWGRAGSALSNRTVGAPFTRAWRELQARYRERHPDGFPRGLPLVEVPEINDPATRDALETMKPDLVAVSGTNLVGPDLIRGAPPSGMLNLHTGISPYVKGGPNCTNWCLAKGWFHLIGNTVMWIDEGIDTGRLIVTERTALSGEETLGELHWEVMEHAHKLYTSAIDAIARGSSADGVPQSDLGAGTTFFNRDWNVRAMLRARRNFASGYRAGLARGGAERVRLVELGTGPGNGVA